MNDNDIATKCLHDLEMLTAEFFQSHWDKTSAAPLPTWKSVWKWTGSVPYHDKAGVYALFDSDMRVVYIGVGTSTGNRYPEHGISRRLIAHVIEANPDYKKTPEEPQYIAKSKWKKFKIEHLGAVGFPREFAYLALALEAFLIEKLAPIANRRK
jgi:hypothetical protein